MADFHAVVCNDEEFIDIESGYKDGENIWLVWTTYQLEHEETIYMNAMCLAGENGDSGVIDPIQKDDLPMWVEILYAQDMPEIDRKIQDLRMR